MNAVVLNSLHHNTAFTTNKPDPGGCY